MRAERESRLDMDVVVLKPPKLRAKREAGEPFQAMPACPRNGKWRALFQLKPLGSHGPGKVGKAQRPTSPETCPDSKSNVLGRGVPVVAGRLVLRDHSRRIRSRPLGPCPQIKWGLAVSYSLEAKSSDVGSGRSAPPSRTVAKAAPAYQVIRRNGTVTPFDASKITIALTKAFLAVEGGRAAASRRLMRM